MPYQFIMHLRKLTIERISVIVFKHKFWKSVLCGGLDINVLRSHFMACALANLTIVFFPQESEDGVGEGKP